MGESNTITSSPLKRRTEIVQHVREHNNVNNINKTSSGV